MNLIKSVLLLTIVIILSSCSESRKGESEEYEDEISEKLDKAHRDSVELAELIAKHDIYPLIEYEHIVIRDNKHLGEIREQFKLDKENPSINKAFLTLNRKERRFVKVGDTIVVPKEYFDDMCAYSVFPQYYHGARDIPKLILVSNRWQAYACYENGVQVRFAAANTGKEKTPTFPGRYALVWKQLVRKSSLDSTWIMPFTWNFHRYAGSAFHKFDMPGYAASHSCVRQFLDDAEWLYNWGQRGKLDSNNHFIHLTGTPVLILDVFDFTRPKTGPWFALKSNKDFIIKVPENPMEFEEAYIPIQQIPKTSRGILPDRNRYIVAEDTLRARGHIREGVKLTESVDFNEVRRKKKAAKLKSEAEKAKEAEEADSKYDSDPEFNRQAQDSNSVR
ncbi:MAG: L,D-transpeptidase [Candidatus Kapabacteria bacterium]|nr:L,D-transpeptidase [Candidatus Kapabacteria bacterium]